MELSFWNTVEVCDLKITEVFFLRVICIDVSHIPDNQLEETWLNYG
jgi:hypothetical protein